MRKMKNLIILLYFLSLFSCKKENKTVPDQTQDGIKILTLPLDSKKISYNSKDKNGFFIYDKTFKKNAFSDALSRVYGKISFNKNVDLILIERKAFDDEHTEPVITMYSFDNIKKQKIDSLDLYETMHSEGTAEKRFIIDRNKKVSIYYHSSGYDIGDDGKEILVTENTETMYSISDTGKFTVSQTKNTAPQITPVTETADHDHWEGTYHFEASNRDQIKTRYDIVINSLHDISIRINDGGDKESYSHIEAEILNGDKIKLVFNPALEDEMGIIYIEKSDDTYLISGYPIYFINPGNNEMPLVKEK